MVGDGLGAARAWAASGTLTALSLPPWLLASVEDFLHPLSLWLSSLGCSGTSCLAHLPSPPCVELVRFMLLVCLNLIFLTSYMIRGAWGNLSGNLICFSRALWLMVYSFLVQTAWQFRFVVNVNGHVSCCLPKHIFVLHLLLLILISTVHMLCRWHGFSIVCYKYGSHIVNFHYGWKLNQNVHAF